MLESAEPLNVWLATRDLERARRFYGDLLGLPLWREEPHESLHFGVGGAILSVRLAGKDDLPPRGGRLVFNVPSGIDRLCEEMISRGLEFEEPLGDRPFGRGAMFLDPDGHELWVCEPSATETQFELWRSTRRSRERRIPVQRPPAKVRRHERSPPTRRSPHPQE